MMTPYATRSIIALLATFSALPVLGAAQEQPDFLLVGDNGEVEAYLRDKGLFDDALRIQAAWKRLDPGEDPALNARAARTLGALIGVDVLMNGYTYESVSRLKNAGFDLERLVRTVPGPVSLADIAARSEIVIIGTVVDRYDSMEPRDGFRSSAVIHVEEFLRGDLEGRFVILRLSSGRNARGGYARRSHEFDGAVGDVFLFFLSNGLYRFHSGYADVGLNPWIIDRAYQMQDQQRGARFRSVWTAVPMPPSGWDELESELDEVRRIGALIRTHSR